MSYCPQCNSNVPRGQVLCGICGATNQTPGYPPDASSEEPLAPQNAAANKDLYVRLEKAMRRTELLSYAAAGLGAVILLVLVGIAFL